MFVCFRLKVTSLLKVTIYIHEGERGRVTAREVANYNMRYLNLYLLMEKFLA